MADEQREFWSAVAEKYDRVVDVQIGPQTRSMVRERVAKEGALGHLAEFGCGTGFYTEVLARKADRVVATDLAPGMLALAKQRVTAANVTFQAEDCQKTSLPDGAFDTAFVGLVMHFTEPDRTLAEMRRILKPGGALIIANVDPLALGVLARVRCLIRVLYHGVTGYRMRPPKGFGRNLLTEQQLCARLGQSGFKVLSTETIRDTSRASNIPIEYVRSVKA
jgi:ubiquinone/menaquinone biosynthesis C-methylase UbiE